MMKKIKSSGQLESDKRRLQKKQTDLESLSGVIGMN